MKNRKRNMVISLLIMDVMLCLILTSIFNYTINAYLDREVRESLLYEASYLGKDEIIEEDIFDEVMFTVVTLYTDDSYLTDNDNYIMEYEPQAEDDDINNQYNYMNAKDYERDNYLLRQCRINKDKLERGEVVVTKVLNEQYYIMQRNDIEYSEPGVTTAILYVNTSPFERLIYKINWILAFVVLLSVIIIGFLGLKAGEKLEDTDKKMKQFFENVSHELKTPIMSIQGYAEGIEQGIMKDNKAAARVIMSESEKMTNMVNQILELSKLESGALKVYFQNNDIAEIIYECLERLTSVADKKGIAFNVNISKSCNLSCDSDMIEKVILNILTNALRYARSEIGVDLYVNSNDVKVCITDDGGALTEEDAQHIFERFYRGKAGLTGVGLSLAKEIIMIHKGTIHVDTKPRTRFTIVLNR